MADFVYVSAGLLSITSLIYLWVAVGYIQQGRYGMGLAFAAYAMANLGFVIDVRGQP